MPLSELACLRELLFGEAILDGRLVALRDDRLNFPRVLE